MLFLHVHVQIKIKMSVQCSTMSCQVTPLAQLAHFTSPRSVECQEAAAGADNFNSLTALSHLPLIKTKYFNSL